MPDDNHLVEAQENPENVANLSDRRDIRDERMSGLTDECKMNQCMQRKNEAEHFQFYASVNYIFSEQEFSQSEYTKVEHVPLWSSLHNKSGVYIGEGGAIMLATMSSDSDTLILALATFGSMT